MVVCFQSKNDAGFSRTQAPRRSASTGGLSGNLSRVLPKGLEARIDWHAWDRPSVFTWLADQGIEEDELRRVFNLGIGMCAVVPEAPTGAIVIGELA